jgi:hypothetical protein
LRRGKCPPAPTEAGIAPLVDERVFKEEKKVANFSRLMARGVNTGKQDLKARKKPSKKDLSFKAKDKGKL